MSKIEWTERTWNPIVGCRRVSAGCDNCYAILEAHRKGSIFPHYAGLTANDGSRVDWTGKFSVAPDHIMNKPLRTSAPTVWFVNSMSDLFGEGVPDATIQRVFAIMNATPHHRYQVLTKRANRAAKLAPMLTWTPNIWMGVSIEDDRYTGRADLLRKIPTAVRFISAEPLLGPLPNLDLAGIDWVIVGGESGRSRDKVREMDADWARDLRDRCVAVGTAFFFKQWGNWRDGVWHRAKSDAGRELDGRTWDEMPVGRRRDLEPKRSKPPVPPEQPSRETIKPRGPVKPDDTTTKPEGPVGWTSIDAFRLDLLDEHVSEEEAPTHRGQSPRLALREPIWRALRDHGPLDGHTLRTVVLDAEGLDAASARIVNFHAWALVDLQANGWVEAFESEVAAKRGHTRKAKLYRAIKPRVRIRQEREVA